MAFVEVNGLDLHYLERGSGTPVVFLHGFGSCAEAWFQQFDALADRYRCIAYDSVNHGYSQNSADGEPEPDRADELEGLLGALAIDAPVLVGNSMGALTLLRWAARHPSAARALVPSGMGITASGEHLSPERRRQMFEPVGDDVLFLPAPGGFTERFPTDHPVRYDRYLRLRSTATRLEASRRPREPSFVDPTWDELGERIGDVSSPMQIIVGEHDRLAEPARHLHELVSGSRLAVIPQGPHNVYYETAVEFNRILVDFLADVAAPSSIP
jgi:pimeloyl-ACP methyl ester carboxylesterase